MKIAVIGGPRTGKSTLAEKLGQELSITYVMSADDLIGEMEWSQVSDKIARDMHEIGGNAIWEGVRVTHALRKFLSLYPGKPVDKVYRLTRPWQPLTKGQLSMLVGDDTMWLQIKDELLRRGVELI